MHIHLISLVISYFAALALTANVTEWRSRSIYQIITDRFALTDGSTTASCDPALGKYCGGTWAGISNNLDYIQNMGFDAIWISPVTAQVENMTKDLQSYHGYWQTNLYELNPHFGTAADLRILSKELHARDMYLMVDIVVNDMAFVGAQDNVVYSTLKPFDNEEYYHSPCFVDDPGNITNVEECWLGDDIVALPDLRTEDKNVAQGLYEWISELVSNYSIDGLRIDSAANVNPGFWSDFNDAAGVFGVGEIYDTNYSTLCKYQDILTSVLNYPTYLPMTMAFNATNGSMSDLTQSVLNVKSHCRDSTLMGTFSENHDVPRFASYTSDMTLAKNIITFTILSDGIPIIYQGQEQHTTGRYNPVNRAALWLSKYNVTSELYEHITALNNIRSHAFAHSDNYAIYKAYPLYNDSETIVLRKGFDGQALLTVLTNQGEDGDKHKIMIDGTGYSSNQVIIEVLTCTNFTTENNGSLEVTVQDGAPMVFYPAEELDGYSSCQGNYTKASSDGQTQGAHHHKGEGNVKMAWSLGGYIWWFAASLLVLTWL
ncbi:MAG: hypothetical protein M1834_005331 [Cirrosporium novae-zelandiae]|nr:MAG: hypothetical protein M1834_005331 [Cirrosporium novae-zelandiae]